jgi:hypothetical protein
VSDFESSGQRFRPDAAWDSTSKSKNDFNTELFEKPLLCDELNIDTAAPAAGTVCRKGAQKPQRFSTADKR